MRRLLMQWSYAASVYCHEALMWFFFKSKDGVRQKVERINSAKGPNYLVYSEGFVSSTGVELPLDASYGIVNKTQRCLYIGMQARQLDSNWTVATFDAGDPLHFLDVQSGEVINASSMPFDCIYSDAVAERMTSIQFEQYLKSIIGLLKPGGVHRIATSDIDRILDTVSKGTWVDFPWVKKEGVTTAAEYINAVFRNWGHRYLYDSATLIKRLSECGYRNSARTSMLSGCSASLYCLDQGIHRIYVEAQR
ncbi:hypothetical protein ACX0MV_15130 [Pseudomonas borbori]